LEDELMDIKNGFWAEYVHKERAAASTVRSKEKQKSRSSALLNGTQFKYDNNRC
jgi:hypothetical protein